MKWRVSHGSLGEAPLTKRMSNNHYKFSFRLGPGGSKKNVRGSIDMLGGKENESKMYVIAKTPLQASIYSSMVKFRSKGILLMEEIPKDHLTCMKPCKNWDTYQKEPVSLLVLFPSTESFWDIVPPPPPETVTTQDDMTFFQDD